MLDFQTFREFKVVPKIGPIGKNGPGTMGLANSQHFQLQQPE